MAAWKIWSDSQGQSLQNVPNSHYNIQLATFFNSSLQFMVSGFYQLECTIQNLKLYKTRQTSIDLFGIVLMGAASQVPTKGTLYTEQPVRVIVPLEHGIIETKNLHLRPLRANDAAQIFEYRSRQDVADWL